MTDKEINDGRPSATLGGVVTRVISIPAVMTIEEACSLLKLSRPTLRHYVSVGLLRPMRVGAKGTGIRFAGTEIQRFMDELMGGE